MPKFSRFIFGLTLVFVVIFHAFPLAVLAGDPVTPQTTEESSGSSETQTPGVDLKADPGSPLEATFKGRCESAGREGSIYEKFPPCATSPNQCGSNDQGLYPLNCKFLTEPIGGKTGYDLYKRVRIEKAAQTKAETPKGFGDAAAAAEEAAKKADGEVENQVLEGESPSEQAQNAEQPQGEALIDEVEKLDGTQGEQADGDILQPEEVYKFVLWYGEFIVRGNEEGPYQAILAYEPGKDYQGPFGLLYSYLGLAYNYISGFILAVVILIAIVGGIEMIASNGNAEQFGKGQEHITKALIGMVVWFLASVILYTINPTFFSF